MKYLSVTLLCLLAATINAANDNAPSSSTKNSNAASSAKEGKKVNTVAAKFATVNLQLICPRDGQDTGALYWRDAINAIKESLKPGDAELQKKDEAYEKGRKEIESLAKSGMVTQEAMQKKAQDLYRQEQELNMSLQKRQQFIAEEMANAEKAFYPKLERVLNTIRKEQGLDMIFSSAVVISADANHKFDLTEQVRKMLDVEYETEKKAEAEKNAKSANAKKGAIAA